MQGTLESWRDRHLVSYGLSILELSVSFATFSALTVGFACPDIPYRLNLPVQSYQNRLSTECVSQH